MCEVFLPFNLRSLVPGEIKVNTRDLHFVCGGKQPGHWPPGTRPRHGDRKREFISIGINKSFFGKPLLYYQIKYYKYFPISCEFSLFLLCIGCNALWLGHVGLGCNAMRLFKLQSRRNQVGRVAGELLLLPPYIPDITRTAATHKHKIFRGITGWIKGYLASKEH